MTNSEHDGPQAGQPFTNQGQPQQPVNNQPQAQQPANYQGHYPQQPVNNQGQQANYQAQAQQPVHNQGQYQQPANHQGQPAYNQGQPGNYHMQYQQPLNYQGQVGPNGQQVPRNWNLSNQSYQSQMSDVNPVMGRPILDAFFGFFFFLIANVVSGLILVTVAKLIGVNVFDEDKNLVPYGLFSLITIQAVIIIIFVAIHSNLGNRQWKEFLGFRFRWLDIVWAILALVGMRIIVSIPALLGFVPQDIDMADSAIIQPGMNGLEIFFVLIAIAVITPFVEEILFRGIMLRSLERKFGGWVGVIVSSIVFCLMHVANYTHLSIATQVYSLFTVFSLGFSFGVVSYKTGRIGASIIAHMLNNSMVLLAFVLTQNTPVN